MILTRPLPDEFIKGWLARSQAVNLRPGGESFLLLCRDHLRGKGLSSELTPCQTLALATGVEIKRLIGEHTLVPLHCAIAENPVPFAHEEKDGEHLLERSALRLLTGEIRYCVQCSSEDVSRMGFSYWRRIHQLTGVHWCPRHNSELLRISSRGRRSWGMPSSQEAPARRLNDVNLESLCCNQVLARYVEILIGFLNATGPISTTHANHKLRFLAKQRNILIGTKGDKQLLSDFIAERVPAIWFVDTFPKSPVKVDGRRYGAIDNVLMGCLPITAIAITLAALFDSAREAIDYWYGSSSDVPPSRKTYRKHHWDHWGSREFFDEYVSEDGKLLRLARRKNMNHDHLREKLNQAGMPALSWVNMNTTGSALLDYADGVPLDEACMRYQADKNDVERFVLLGAARFIEAFRLIHAKATGVLNPAPALQKNLDRQTCNQDPDLLGFG